jgi:cytochrome c peroxidase
MTLSPGDRLPAATFVELGEGGPRAVASEEVFAGRKVALFAVPGAYTGVCSAQHVPSFIRAREALAAKGVEAIVCLAVNDPFVLKAWGEATGAAAAGIRMLGDPAGDFTRAIGMEFDRPEAGLIGRSRRYAALVEDGVARVVNIEASPGQCETSAGEALAAAI